MTLTDPLTNPAWGALTGAHQSLGTVNGRAARYAPEVSPFSAVTDSEDPRAWADLANLAGPDTDVTIALEGDPPKDWQVKWRLPGVRMSGAAVVGATSAEALTLGPDDVPEMIDLVSRTKPGPFLRRTIEMGTYLGIRSGGALVAMAGERFRAPGWTEISAVCTDPAYQGGGLATRLVHAIAAGIRHRGATPFLHTAADNVTAIRLYESLGFTVVAEPVFFGLRTPQH